ncbi:MAG: hypothetical protein WC683_18280 [bacterium]
MERSEAYELRDNAGLAVGLAIADDPGQVAQDGGGDRGDVHEERAGDVPVDRGDMEQYRDAWRNAYPAVFRVYEDIMAVVNEGGASPFTRSVMRQWARRLIAALRPPSHDAGDALQVGDLVEENGYGGVVVDVDRPGLLSVAILHDGQLQYVQPHQIERIEGGERDGAI